MAVELNHTIVYATNSEASATFAAEILGLAEPTPFGPFMAVETANGVTLDFMDSDDEIVPQHYAFLISEAEFDEIFARIQQRDLPYWPIPAGGRQGRSTRTMVAAASTSRILTVTSSRSSPGHTAAAVRT